MEQPIWQLEWNETLSVGIPEIDKEHQHFILLVNGLNQAISDHLENVDVLRRMQLILDDWKQHHGHEEELLKQCNYPETDEHVKQHEIVTKQLNEIWLSLAHAVVDYEYIAAALIVKEMLIGHILNEDMKYIDFFRAMPNRVTSQ